MLHARGSGGQQGSSLQSYCQLRGNELLKELLPALKRVGVLFNSEDPVTGPQIRDTLRAAEQLSVEIRLFPVRNEETLSASFSQLITRQSGAIMCACGPGISLPESNHQIREC